MGWEYWKAPRVLAPPQIERKRKKPTKIYGADPKFLREWMEKKGLTGTIQKEGRLVVHSKGKLRLGMTVYSCVPRKKDSSPLW